MNSDSIIVFSENKLNVTGILIILASSYIDWMVIKNLINKICLMGRNIDKICFQLFLLLEFY